MASDFSGLIPIGFAREILQSMVAESAVMRLANVQRMSNGQSQIPVLSALPQAGFISGPGGIKPVAEMQWTSLMITAEEIAALLPVPRAYIDDAAFNIWGEVRPRLSEALAKVADDALLSGTGAPPSFPAGGVAAVAAPPINANPTPQQPDIVEAISMAMTRIEDSGLEVNGFAARTSVRGHFRGVRDTTGDWLVYPPQSAGAPSTMWGQPLMYSRIGFRSPNFDLIAGDWSALVVGMREDMRFDISTDGVIRNPATGAVTVSAFQDDVAIMRVYMRLGAVIGRPVTNRPDGTQGVGTPFASVRAPLPGNPLQADLEVTGPPSKSGTAKVS